MLKGYTRVPRDIPLEALGQRESCPEACQGGPAGSPEAALSSAACELGFYKSAPGDQLCARCPPHSHSAAPAAQACHCDLSYYRAALDPPSAACTREYHPSPSILEIKTGPGPHAPRTPGTQSVLCG